MGQNPAPGDMAMIRRILIPLDLTSAEPLRLAVRLFRLFPFELKLLHCLPASARSARFFFPRTPETDRRDCVSPEEKRMTEERLSALMSDHALGDLPYTLHVVRGMVLPEILKRAATVHPDLIIQGRRNSFRREEWISGGLSRELIQKASCPVVTVKHRPFPSRLLLRPGESPLLTDEAGAVAVDRSVHEPGKVILLTDFGTPSTRALPHAAWLACRMGSELVILHVLEKNRGDFAEEAASRLRFLVERAEALQLALKVSSRLEIGHPEQTIIPRIGRPGLALVVMGAGNTRGSGSLLSKGVLEKILRWTACPVMTVSPEGFPQGIDSRYRSIFRRMNPEDLIRISEEQPEAIGEEIFGFRRSSRAPLFLGHYTQSGLTRVFEEYGIFPLLRQKGFNEPKIRLNFADSYQQRLRISFNGGEDENHTLIDLILSEGILESARERTPEHQPRDMRAAPDIPGRDRICPAALRGALQSLRPTDASPRGRFFPVLMVEWLGMQNPRAAFTPKRPPLPGQLHPGLGISREILQLILLIGMRTGKDGVAIHPQYYHAARLYHGLFQCYNPIQEGQLGALMRDTEAFNLNDVSWAIDLGCLLDGPGEGKRVSWGIDWQVHPLTSPLKSHFHAEHYGMLYGESLARQRYGIDWQRFEKKFHERITGGSLPPQPDSSI
jgi:nucleotide-binding universal stress UspA family protein